MWNVPLRCYKDTTFSAGKQIVLKTSESKIRNKIHEKTATQTAPFTGKCIILFPQMKEIMRHYYFSVLKI